MPLLFPFKGSKRWRVKVFIVWESFGFLKYTGGGCVIFRVKDVQALVARKEQRARA